MFLVFPSLVKVGKMVVGKIFQREQGVVIVEELELIFIALWHLPPWSCRSTSCAVSVTGRETKGTMYSLKFCFEFLVSLHIQYT